jgi:transposase
MFVANNNSELRRRVVETVLDGATLDEAAGIHGVGRASANRWTTRFKKTG